MSSGLSLRPPQQLWFDKVESMGNKGSFHWVTVPMRKLNLFLKVFERTSLLSERSCSDGNEVY